MADENTVHNQPDETHFWVDCSACGYGGQIGVPVDYPADVVVCPKCRQVVRVRPQDRVLWRPADPTEFLGRRFPDVAWKTIDRETDTGTPAGAFGRTLSDGARDAALAGDEPNSSRQPSAERSQEMARRESRHAGTRKPGLATLAPQGNRATEWRELVSEALDNELVQYSMIIAAGIVPIALAVMLPGLLNVGRSTRGVQMASTSQKAATSPKPPILALRRPPAVDHVQVALSRPTNMATEPSSAQVYLRAWQPYRRGIAHFEQVAYVEAVRDFTEAIRWKQDSARSFHWRALALIELGQLDAALADMNRSIAFRPSDPVAHHARAVVFDRLRRYEEARGDMAEALYRSPRNRVYLDYLARLQAKMDAAPASIVSAWQRPLWEDGGYPGLAVHMAGSRTSRTRSRP